MSVLEFTNFLYSRCKCINLFYMYLLNTPVIPIVTAITPLDRPLTRREGASVVIQLNVSGNPQPTFSWRQVGSQMSLSNGSGIIVAYDTLTFDNIGREHTGQYVYEAINSVGMTNISFELDVLCKLIKIRVVTSSQLVCSLELRD